MDSDAILTAVNAAESMVNAPHEPERSSYRARKAMEEEIHLIFLLCGIVAVAFVLLISLYLILSGLPARSTLFPYTTLFRSGSGTPRIPPPAHSSAFWPLSSPLCTALPGRLWWAYRWG